MLQRNTMIRPFALASFLALLAAPVAGKGELGTLPLGRYLCELPGDAGGPASVPVDGAWFDIVNASSYDAEGGSGTYLLAGKRIVFTRGPMKGAEFERVSSRRLDRTDLDGELSRLRCVRTGRAD